MQKLMSGGKMDTKLARNIPHYKEEPKIIELPAIANLKKPQLQFEKGRVLIFDENSPRLC